MMVVESERLLTSSRITCWQKCPRMHHYRYEIGLVLNAIETGARATGSAAHKGLEAWWLCHKRGVPDLALSVALVEAERAFPTDDPFALAMLRALLHGYDARWGEWARTVEVLGVEVAFKTSLWDPITDEPSKTWRVAGKIDAMLRLEDGRIAILEHKTSSADVSVGSDYRRRLTLDPQVSTYFDGAAELGWEADLCLYDVLKKPVIKPLLATPEEDRVYSAPKSRACKACKARGEAKPPPHYEGDVACVDGTVRGNKACKACVKWSKTTEAPHAEDGVECEDGRVVTDHGGRLSARQRDADETPSEYEARLCACIAADPDKYLSHVEIVRSAEERESHVWALWHAAKAIDTSRDNALALRDVRAVSQHSNACFAMGCKCDFIDICEGTANPRDTSRFRRLRMVHPELSAEGGEQK